MLYVSFVLHETQRSTLVEGRSLRQANSQLCWVYLPVSGKQTALAIYPSKHTRWSFALKVMCECAGILCSTSLSRLSLGQPTTPQA